MSAVWSLYGVLVMNPELLMLTVMIAAPFLAHKS